MTEAHYQRLVAMLLDTVEELRAHNVALQAEIVRLTPSEEPKP